jgi:glycosyltransferase involved in cell wall biosynthesis
MKTIIISPSGNFYGSEQVLFDFLKESIKTYTVYVPGDSLLAKKLKQEQKHKIKSFKSLPQLYLALAFKLLLSSYAIYINEGGHVRYVKLLAKMFPNRKFILQIRLLSDTNPERLGKLPSNIKIVCVSNFIAAHIPEEYNPIVLNDPFQIPEKKEKVKNTSFTIGFIGRVTPTKGLKEISILLDALETKGYPLQINFLGQIENDKKEVKQFVEFCKNYKSVKTNFKGFIDNKLSIYKDLDLVIHLNKEEAFPRVALESWAFGVPLIGFDAGGVGEINHLLNVSDFLIPLEDNWIHCLLEKISKIKEDYPVSSIDVAQQEIRKNLSLKSFTNSLEELIH